MTIYYVSTYGNNNNAGTSMGAAWRTIGYAAGQASAGDTVRVEAGTYSEYVNLSGVNGTSGNIITIRAHDLSKKPVIRSSNSRPNIRITDCSYLTWQGFELRDFDGPGMWVLATESNISNVTIDQCNFIRATESKGHMIKVETATANQSATQIHITDCYFYDCWPGVRNSAGKIIGNEIVTFIGNVRYSSMRNNHLDECKNIGLNCIGYHKRSPSIHKGQPAYIVYSGNLITNMYNYGSGVTLYSDRALGPMLIENNIVISPHPTGALSLSGETGGWDGNLLDKENWGNHQIVRNNVLRSGGYKNARFGMRELPNYPCHNMVAVHNVMISDSTANYSHAPICMGFVDEFRCKNNVIVHNNTKNDVILNMEDQHGSSFHEDTWEFDGNLWYSVQGQSVSFEWPSGDKASWSAWKSATGQGANGQWGAPVFEDESGRDYRLASSSPGNGDAIPLTYANGSGSSSTTLIVDDARYFCDGWSVVGGDQIDVGGATTTVTAVNWSTNTLTVSPAITWSDNDPVHYIYSGTAPSIGLTDAVGTGEPITPPGGGDAPPDEAAPPAPPSAGVELLNNESFTVNAWNAQYEWRKHSSGSATFTISGGQCTVNVSDSGGNTQLYQADFPIVASDDYEIEIVASAASGSHVLNVRLIEHQSPYANLGVDEDITVTTTPTTFTIPFVASGRSDNARLQVRFPTTGANIVFDSISLMRVATAGAPGGSSGAPSLSMTEDGEVRPNTSGYDASREDLRLGWIVSSSTQYHVWLRAALPEAIPSGATINSATLSGKTQTVNAGRTTATIKCEDSSNGSTVGSYANWSAKSWTSGTSWSLTGLSAWSAFTSANFAAEVQSLVDSYSGLASGAYIVVGLFALASQPGSDDLIKLCANEHADGPLELVIEWEVPDSTPPVPPSLRTLTPTLRQTFRMSMGR